ncbi:MAG: hypothetical protein JNM90_03810 [Burkholderiales bacterium]|nr:hypothetical protein [Burkholderiales bacterium]
MLAEFHCHGATAWPDARTVVTQGGAMRVASDVDPLPLAYETPSANPRLWNHGVVFCLPEAGARRAARRRVTALGPDRDAIDASERDAELFDLGLGLATTDFLVRTRDPGLTARLRAAEGATWDGDHALQAAIVRASPTRVLVSRLARIEVRNPIPAADGVSPEGPHTHLLPAVMRRGRVHDANIPVPAGFLPCLTLYPPHPARDAEGRERAFDADAHRCYQALLERFGDPVYTAAKRGVPAAESRIAHLGRLIAARQRAFTGAVA